MTKDVVRIETEIRTETIADDAPMNDPTAHKAPVETANATAALSLQDQTLTLRSNSLLALTRRAAERMTTRQQTS